MKQDDTYWRGKLTAEQYNICRRKATERAFSGAYHDCKKPGTYRCVCCGAALFHSGAKFDSGTGWPSFWAPIESKRITMKDDKRLWMKRTEVLCSACDAHLGHVFDDGPDPTGKRYCINSVSLMFRQEGGDAD